MKNRTAIGIVCIVLAVAVTFIVSPFVTRVSDKKTEVVRFTRDIARGTMITDEDLETAEASSKGLPENILKSKEDVVGKYATADLFSGDFATQAKVCEKADTADDVLSALTGNKSAMSITVKSFAAGLSGKLQNGDIISIYVSDGEGTKLQNELKYVKVITTTTSNGVDENDVVKNDDGSFDLPSTVTVLVSQQQAVLLADNEENSSMHVALVYRGEDKTAEKFITIEDNYLKSAAQAESDTQGGESNNG